MNLLFQLIFRDAWYHRSRISLAVLATVAMSCMIVWLIGSLDLMILRFDHDAENYLGHYHLVMVPGKEIDTTAPGPLQDAGRPSAFPDAVIAELEKEELVVQVTPARQIRNVMGKMKHMGDTDAALRRQRSITGLPTQSPAVIGIATDASPFILTEGRWFSDEWEGVMGTAAATSLQDYGGEYVPPVKVGDSVICRVGTNDFKITIVGLVEQNVATGGRFVDPAAGAVFVSAATARQMGDDRIDYIYVRLREGTNTKRFAETWGKHLSAQQIDMQFFDADKIQDKLNRIRTQSTAGLVGGAATLNSIIIFASLVSVLIVFTALSMGVTERTRVFAMLRTVGMTRRKIAILVFGESVILCSLGWLGGLIAGWCVLQLSVWMQPEIFGTGKTVSLGMTPILTSGLAALIASILAACIPIWRATQISPLEGMNRGYVQTIAKRWFLLGGLFGAALLLVNPIIVYHESIAANNEMRLLLYTYIGLPTQIIGCLLLVPAVILFVEKLFTPVVARLLRLPKQLLASQLSANLWRTLGTTLALCVGLGVYSFLEISGYSMLVPYIQSTNVPDTLATFLPSGVPTSEIDTVRNIPGVDASRFLMLAIDQSRFSQTQAERFMANGLIQMQTSAVVFGIDIDEAFGQRADGTPLLELPFREGTLESALEKLRTGGRYCLVPDSFAFRANVHVGDKLELVVESATDLAGTPAGQEVVEYEICGIVSIHGWLWMNKVSGVRKRGFRSGAMLLAPYEAVKNDYRLNEAAYFWFDRLPGVSDEELEASLQHLADRLAPPSEGVSRPMVKVSSRQYLKNQVGDRADEVIQAAAKMPLILLAISSFGMMGTIAAAIRSRRFEFGVLRSLGLTRFGLVRLILAEALLIALAAMIISVGFGVLAGWCFIGLMKYVAGFGGFTSPLTIPVYWLSLGLGVALIFCFLAAVGPAIVAGRTVPTRLLQERTG